MKKIAHNPEEVLAIVDKNDKVIGCAKRKEVHIGKGLLHREAYNYLINSKKEVLLQKRADDHKWDHSAAGHFQKNQNYKTAAKREFEEELGIRLKNEELKEIAHQRINYRFRGGTNNRFVKVFLVKKNVSLKKFKIDEGEIEDVAYFNKKELKKLLNKKSRKITRSAKMLIKKYILRLV